MIEKVFKRKNVVLIFFAWACCCVWNPASCHGGAAYDIIAPKKMETIHTYPVPIIIQFKQGVPQKTFRAWLNEKDITDKFVRTGLHMVARVGPEDGLLFNKKQEQKRYLNALVVAVGGKTTPRDTDSQVLFHVEVGSVTTLGAKGGTVKSPDGNMGLTIPPGALTSVTRICVTKVRVARWPGYAYEISPKDLKLNRPATVFIKSETENGLWAGREKAFYLLSGNNPPYRLEKAPLERSGWAAGVVHYFDKIILSRFEPTGIAATQVPYATDFRVPVGELVDRSYTCDESYQQSRTSDIGDRLGLLSRGVFPEDDSPDIVFNRGGKENVWQVSTAFHVKKSLPPDPLARSRERSGTQWFHEGEDWILSEVGESDRILPIHAIADGMVVYNGPGLGQTVVVGHRLATRLVFSVYSHLSERSPCRVGTVVRKGDIIGKIQSSALEEAYLRFAIGREALVRINPETQQIESPIWWFADPRPDAVYDRYYDPTNFLTNISGKFAWRFSTRNNDEGWWIRNAKKNREGYRYTVREGTLSAIPEKSGFSISSYPLRIDTKEFDTVFLALTTHKLKGRGRFHVVTAEDQILREIQGPDFALIEARGGHHFKFFMGDNSAWRGIVVGIGITFEDADLEPGAKVAVESIRFSRGNFSRVPDTGQVICYDNEQTVSCPMETEPFYGQDAHYAINTPRYTIETLGGDEMVVDGMTGLHWQRTVDDRRRTWREAYDFCKDLMFGGYSDWRLPTRKELETIVGFNTYHPAVDPEYFSFDSSTDARYWSSSTLSLNVPVGWAISFWDGQNHLVPLESPNLVLAVRGRSLAFGHFRDNGDETITDLTTGLTWQKEETKAMTWEKALVYCEALSLGRYDDWRLPNIRELLTLVDDGRRNASIDVSYFPGCRPSHYWSSTSLASYPRFAWHVDFSDGRPFAGGYKQRKYFLRAVRGGNADQ